MLALALLLSVDAADNPFRVQPQGLSVPAGSSAKATFVITVPDGTFLYQDMTEVKVVASAPLTAGAPDLPPAVEKEDPVLGMTRSIWDQDVYIEIPVTAPAELGDHSLVLEARYQGCKGTLCYMPVTEEVTIPVRVLAAVDADAGAP
ncbi:MAG TPA: protein-disulfide reductase DsbD N-terminal domain-containing protein [Myxococcota bacterium]|nr:protein-disulfide reductase DsbD N-terminal domain-containing protein [Myxococcota bacterium]